MADKQAVKEILDFWFGVPGSPEFGRSRDVWFRKDAAFDAQIRERFSTLHAAVLAEPGGQDDWHAEPDTLLALIVLLDQFSRNMYRGESMSFAGDSRALAAAVRMVEQGWDRAMPAVKRWFVYMPFEHSENLSDQDRAVRLMQDLEGDAATAGVVEWAIKHRDVVARFGRFPHRNAILGRASTQAEIEFLKQPGSSF